MMISPVPMDEHIYQFQLDIDTVPHIVYFIAKEELNKYWDKFNLSPHDNKAAERFDEAIKVI